MHRLGFDGVLPLGRLGLVLGGLVMLIVFRKGREMRQTRALILVLRERRKCRMLPVVEHFKSGEKDEAWQGSCAGH